MQPDGALTASVTLSNSGTRSGGEAVLWFISAHFGKITRPVKLLKKCEKKWLEPGKSCRLEFQISREELSYPDAMGRPVLEETSYSVKVGSLEKRFRVAR